MDRRGPADIPELNVILGRTSHLRLALARFSRRGRVNASTTATTVKKYAAQITPPTQQRIAATIATGRGG